MELQMIANASKETRKCCKEYWGLTDVWSMEGCPRNRASRCRTAWAGPGPLQPAALGTLVADFLYEEQSLALFFSSGIISPSEKWAALGCWHLMHDVCPRFPPAVPATPAPYMGMSHIELGEDEWYRGCAGSSTLSTAPVLTAECYHWVPDKLPD